MLFLGELEELLELTQQPEFANLIPSLFYRISQCLMSQHFQVAERALFLWNNETVVVRITENRCVTIGLPSHRNRADMPRLQFAGLTQTLCCCHHREAIFPIVFGALTTNTAGHWNSTVHGLTYNVQKLLMEMDSELYDEEAEKYEAKQKSMAEREAVQKASWTAIEAMAGSST